MSARVRDFELVEVPDHEVVRDLPLDGERFRERLAHQRGTIPPHAAVEGMG